MNVFTVYVPQAAGSLRLWARSWKQNGYTPKLITPREVREHGGIKHAVRKRGGGIFVIPGAFNICHRRGKPSVKKHGSRGWEAAAIVRFSLDAPESLILSAINAS